MPWTDYQASSRIRELRESMGLSPEALAEEITTRSAREGWRGGVDASTIRRLEGVRHLDGTEIRPPLVPGLRVRVLLEAFFGERLWNERRWVRSQAERERVKVAA